MKVIVFGAGYFGKLYAEQEDSCEIVAFSDNNDRLWGRTFFGHKIIPPMEIPKYEFDKIVICVDDFTLDDEKICKGAIAMDEIFSSLQDLGIDESKISANGIHMRNDRRVLDLRKLAIELSGKAGSVAECGVLRGHFAGYINEIFPDRKLYLFDTFSGFDARDVDKEPTAAANAWIDTYGSFIRQGNEKIALSRCPYRDNVIVRRGYIPESFHGLENECFIYVYMDMDLYLPTLAALRFFAPRMSQGGIISLHDYYEPQLPGIKQAVDEFSSEYNFIRIPTGDVLSVALCSFDKVRSPK